jgi:hypothetical protein
MMKTKDLSKELFTVGKTFSQAESLNLLPFRQVCDRRPTAVSRLKTQDSRLGGMYV